MATCLCAPTTHEGSFRCRLHRGNPMILEGSTHSCSSNLETKPRPTCEGLQEDGGQSMSVLRPSPSLPRQISIPKSAIDRYGNRNLCLRSQLSSPPPSCSAYLPSKTSNTSSQSPSTTSSPQFRPRRPPLSPKARCASPSVPTSGSSSIGSETTHSKVIAAAVYESPSRISAEKRGSTSSIAGRAAAMAILKRHMNNKGNKNNNGIMPRSVERRKIGLSRFSKMERQRKDQELPLR
ncbi:hypothetical protein KP509_23G038200 [Ceratopteris richardii]|nr:hypothetical protein KP509_23G038200 [Ceratopteris richardii]